MWCEQLAATEILVGPFESPPARPPESAKIPLISVPAPIRDDHLQGSRRRNRTRQAAVLFALVVAALSAGSSSWLIERPGDTLFFPMALDVGIFLLFAVAGLLMWRPWLEQSGGSGYAIALPVVGIACLLWTYFGVLPASVTFDSSATNVARHDVAVKAQGCQLIERGSVGFLRAPYKICTYVIPRASKVSFSTPDFVRGYAYVTGQVGVGWFPDQCSRHLFGNWWAFFNDAVSTTFGCPFGYANHGGG
jgi:hypothetical protein